MASENGRSLIVNAGESRAGIGVRGNADGVAHLEVLREALQVIDWINKGFVETSHTNNADGTPSLVQKLEDRFKGANTRISELERQLMESREENGVLKDKLNAMELLAGHQHSEVLRLTKEAEIHKWEKMDAESRLKKMVKEVAELHVTIGELITKLQQEEKVERGRAKSISQQCPVVIKQELPEVNEQELLEGVKVEEEEKREEVRYMFQDLSSRVESKLQKCEEMQTETREQLAGILSGLSSMERMIQQKKTVKLGCPSRNATKNTTTRSAMIDKRIMRVSPPTPATRPAPAIIPVPIKSILMKRSADGTFVIRRESQEKQKQQEQPPQTDALGVKRKRVHFCLDNSNMVIVRNTDHKENHHKRAKNHHRLADPLAIDNVQGLQSERNDTEHFEVRPGEDTLDRFHCNCGRNFLTKKLLNRHLSAKLNGKIFQCPICTKTFVFHESLKKHVQKSHKIQYHGGRYGCSDCGQTFSLYRQLRQHRLTHQRQKQKLPIKCQIDSQPCLGTSSLT